MNILLELTNDRLETLQDTRCVVVTGNKARACVAKAQHAQEVACEVGGGEDRPEAMAQPLHTGDPDFRHLQQMVLGVHNANQMFLVRCEPIFVWIILCLQHIFAPE